jgi:large subunit ribosomal protein L6
MLKEVMVPQGVEIAQEGSNGSLVVKGPKGELRRLFSYPKVKIKLVSGMVAVESSDDRRRSKAFTGTFASHIKNMIDGVNKGYEARLKVIYSHFPVRIKSEGDVFTIENFLGEKKARAVKILPETEAKIEKDEIIVTGTDKEKVGTTASRIERLTHVTGFDRRVFSDGLYITQKPNVIGGEETVVVEESESAQEAQSEEKAGENSTEEKNAEKKE